MRAKAKLEAKSHVLDRDHRLVGDADRSIAFYRASYIGCPKKCESNHLSSKKCALTKLLRRRL
jgi:hypothetical protein